LRHFRSRLNGFLAPSFLLHLAALAASFSKAEHVQQAADESAMSRLRESFQRAGSPSERDLPGRWVLIRTVATERFTTGRNGPDHVVFDPEGIRRETRGEKRLEWTLSFERSDSGKLQVRSDTVWVPTGDFSPVDFSTEGDLLFEKQYGADSRWIYRCRASNTRQLVCLLKDHESGHGVQFRKISVAQPSAGPAAQRGHIA
jgi:hypothetical protein